MCLLDTNARSLTHCSGCSGMSYTMDFVTEPGDMRADDVVMNVSEDIEIRVVGF